jgi:hypothetical protein
VINHQAYDDLMLYPLSLIPGTELHQRAPEFGLCAMPAPPYLITQTPTLRAPEINQAFRYYEESLEEEVSPLEIPPFMDESFSSVKLPPGLLYRVDWNRPETIKTLSHPDSMAAYALTVRMTREVLKESRLWIPVLKDHLEKKPFNLLSIEVPPDAFPEELDPLWQLARSRSHPIERDYTVTHSPFRSLMILSRSRGLLWKWPDQREFTPLRLHDGQKVSFRPACMVITPGQEIPGWFIDHIHRRYSPPPEIRRWKPPDPSPLR